MAEAIHEWPAVFGSFLRAGFQAEPTWANEESDNDDGSVLLRRRFTDEPVVLRGSVKLRGDLLRIFDAWYEHTLNFGAEWFQVDLLVGKDMLRVDARITGGRKVVPAGQAWKVSFGLRVDEWPVLSEEYLNALLAYGPEALLSLGEVLHTMIHESLPGPLAW